MRTSGHPRWTPIRQRVQGGASKLGGLSLIKAYAACRCSRSPSRNFSGMPIKRRSWSRPRDRRERTVPTGTLRSEEHTSELQSHSDLVCRLLLEKKKKKKNI